ncbi:myosin light chain kinase 2, skeletal/cardiac muscle [Trichomycterus rosablanca]|uniref:myosin light chain kinase 2, skeletal/cardiac muscle n=1 Tax=Trichomycterus rosablanca TaxID=2290929 RepID=UPI002F351BB5
MDDMQRKLDQLLVRSSGGGCPMCGLCTQHSSQLLAQTKLLEALERKVTELRTAVEQLAQGLDDKMSVPLVALQRRKSLPVRTSVEEVYVHLDRLRDQKISQHTLNVPCGKGQAAVVTSTSSTHPKFNVTKFTAPASSTQLQKTKLGISVASQSVEGSLSKPSSQTSTHDTKSPQLNGTITKPVTSGDETLPLKTGLTTSVTQIPSSPPASSVIQGVPAGHNPPKVQGTGVPQSTSQSLAKPITNSQTKNSTLSPPKTLASPKTSAATPFLKQVYSCPDSLQSLQGPIGKAVGKSGTSSAGAAYPGSLTSAGIQIKISPATEKCTAQTKTSPKTCFKIIDDISPQPAPFPHRCVSLRSSPSCDFSIHTRDVLGGGRFGKVHKCTDIKSGLRLAAKILSGRSAKEKEMAVNEIEVMNQLNHPNILQLFDAFESKNQVVLILEYVEGGELLERIVDESCPLTEVDAMVYVKQICEGVQYMHHMYVLHLDLKPENILCVNRTSHQIKIIDFGLARRYKPREKLKVSFGTPEFLAPEVVNFDFVSFPTDMWTLGVVTYMLLSGLSPFLGDDDSETLNNVLTVNWYFDEETFEHVSDEAKDFVSNLLIRERSGRLSAAQCLKHPWLNNISEKAKRSNIVLKSQVLLRKYMARRLWKKNYIAIAAANRFKKIGSSGSLTSLGV